VSVGIAWAGTPSDGTALAGIPVPGMTKGKENENYNKNDGLGKSFRNDPFRGCDKPGGNAVSVCSAKSAALMAAGYGELERISLQAPRSISNPGICNLFKKSAWFWKTSSWSKCVPVQSFSALRYRVG
jgi:hypothetical protein